MPAPEVTPDNVVDALVKLKEQRDTAHSLLEALWLELGPYSDNIPVEIRLRLQRYFGFDDSE